MMFYYALRIFEPRRGYAGNGASNGCGGNHRRACAGGRRGGEDSPRPDIDRDELHDDVQFASGELSNDVRDTHAGYRASQPQFRDTPQSQCNGGYHLLAQLQRAPVELPVELRATIAVAIILFCRCVPR